MQFKLGAGMSSSSSIYDFAAWTRLIPESEIRRLLRYNVKYYFAGGKPGKIPIKAMAKILIEMGQEQLKMLDEGRYEEALEQYNYGPTEGISVLREVLAKRMREKDGVEADPNELVITSGSQQALYAILDTLIDKGDVIMVSSPAYLGFVMPAVKLGARVVIVPSDREGIVPEYVDEAFDVAVKELGKKPEILYTIPDSNNPTGSTLSEKRRKQIFDTCAERGMLIIEDAAYREMQFTESRLPPLKAYDKDNKYVAYIRSSSKEAAPLRIGYILVPPQLREEIVKAKGYYDLCSPSLVQYILARYYTKYIDRHLPEILAEYRRRCDALKRAIDESFPAGWRTDPTGGFFIWWESEREDFDSKRFLEEVALKNDIIYVPSHAFYPPTGYQYTPSSRRLSPSSPKTNGMRLCFVYKPPEVLREGALKLGQLLSQHLS